MPAHNTEIADALDQVADLLELEQGQPFRIRAYRNAARVVRGLGKEVAEPAARGEDRRRCRGIGADLAGKIKELAAPGTSAAARPAARQSAGGRAGAAAAAQSRPEAGEDCCARSSTSRALEQLHRAVLDGRVRELPGFGAGIEKKLLRGARGAQRQGAPARFKLARSRALVGAAARLSSRRRRASTR